ncbi:MAG: hypothetical protein H6765_10665 [Candidatus Peribacteria bacterium]|nr:MAG: hypothetical protein H6765_10665 [Candidatus Peribacteria bacterium]
MCDPVQCCLDVNGNGICDDNPGEDACLELINLTPLSVLGNELDVVFVCEPSPGYESELIEIFCNNDDNTVISGYAISLPGGYLGLQ